MNVTIIPLASPRCGYSFQLSATSLRSVLSLSSLKNGYMDPPRTNVASATKALKQTATGIHVAHWRSRRETSHAKGRRQAVEAISRGVGLVREGKLVPVEDER